jgi:hypothetical protein
MEIRASIVESAGMRIVAIATITGTIADGSTVVEAYRRPRPMTGAADIARPPRNLLGIALEIAVL